MDFKRPFENVTDPTRLDYCQSWTVDHMELLLEFMYEQGWINAPDLRRLEEAAKRLRLRLTTGNQ